MTTRRAFIGTLAGGLLAAPLAAEAQPVRGAHIGFLPGGAGAAHRRQLEALREGLRELGYIEGETITITALWPKTPSELPELAAALVKQNVALVVAPPSDAVRAVRRASPTMPIVFAAVADPVGSGFVASLARPGGNITGLSQLNVELNGKRVELLHELFPYRRAVMLGLAPDDTPALAPGDTIIQETERRARALGIEVRLLPVSRVEDLESALGRLDPRRDGGLIVLPTILALVHAKTIADLALKRKLPSVGAFRPFVEEGGLMTYGVDLDDQLRGAATYVDKILKGARPGDLPVRQPSRFLLIINLKTAKALALTVPPSLLLRADQVIE